MASASGNAALGDLEMGCQCSPVPVDPAGATHDVNLRNIGYDRYINTQLAVTVSKPGPGTSLSIPSGSAGLGPLPSGQTASTSMGVDRVTGGHHQHETIHSVVSFGSDAEDEALDDQEKPVYTCICDLDVRVR